MSLSQPRTSNPHPCQKWFEIPLSRGRVALVDEVDYKRVSKFKWSFDGHYANRSVKLGFKRWSHVRLHNFILGQPPKGFEVDHINGNKLDNRRSNLRIATRAENCHNNRTLRKNNHCGIKGVWFRSETGKWCAQLRLGRKTHCLGSFNSLELAAKARAKAEKQFHGEFALNQ